MADHGTDVPPKPGKSTMLNTLPTLKKFIAYLLTVRFERLAAYLARKSDRNNDVLPTFSRPARATSGVDGLFYGVKVMLVALPKNR